MRWKVIVSDLLSNVNPKRKNTLVGKLKVGLILEQLHPKWECVFRLWSESTESLKVLEIKSRNFRVPACMHECMTALRSPIQGRHH